MASGEKPLDELHLLSDRALNTVHRKAVENCAKLLGCDRSVPENEVRRRSAAMLVELEEFAAHMRDRFFSKEMTETASSDLLLEGVC